jgi:hypothetical protein
MKKFSELIVLIILLVGLAPSNSYSSEALTKMQNNFSGYYSIEEIEVKLNQVFDLYEVPQNEENYKTFGGYLVKLQKIFPKITEMEILDYAINSHNQNGTQELTNNISAAPTKIKK